MIDSLPTDAALRAGLASVFADDVMIENRERSAYSSTFPVEKVTVRNSSDRLSLVCKYGESRADSFTGHRRGTSYEAEVYERVLPKAVLDTPRYYGKFLIDPDRHCLVFDFVEGYRVSRTPDSRWLIATCAALAQAHRRSAVDAKIELNRFDRDYFWNWMQGIASLDPQGPGTKRALMPLGGVVGHRVVDILSGATAALIHGELYPANVLIASSGPVFLDWETAGIGPGVLDLATLTYGEWDSDLVQKSVAAYLGAYPAGQRVELERALQAAQIYAAAQTLRFRVTSESQPATTRPQVEAAAAVLARRLADFAHRA